MLKKLHFIAQKLDTARTDVWECEMLYKLLQRDLIDLDTQQYLLAKFANPSQTFGHLLYQLYGEALIAG